MDRGLGAPMGMNKLQGLATIGLLLSLVAGCRKSESSPAAAMEAPPAASAMATTPLAAGRALVTTMNVDLTVDDIDAARARIRAEVEKSGGYVADASTSGSAEDRHASMVLRVPASSAKSVRSSLAAVGTVTSDLEKVEDVTEQSADLNARLQNARMQEKRILEIMEKRTGSIAEVIAAETELARVRESIERMDAQKRSLDAKVDLATIHVSLVSHAAVAAWQTPGKSIASSAKNGAHAAYVAGVYGLMVVATVAPFLVPVVILVIGIVLATKRKKLVA